MPAKKPSICEMQLDLLAKPPLEADAVTVAHDQHPDHKLGIDRRPANVAIKGHQPAAQVSQYSLTTGLTRRNRWRAGMRRSRLKR